MDYFVDGLLLITLIQKTLTEMSGLTLRHWVSHRVVGRVVGPLTERPGPLTKRPMLLSERPWPLKNLLALERCFNVPAL